VADGESVDARNQRLREARAEYQRASQELAAAVLRPLEGRALKRLWVVAEGALQYVPLSALLPDSMEVAALPSAGVLPALLREQSHSAPLNAVAVFADPVFDAQDARVRQAQAAETSAESLSPNGRGAESSSTERGEDFSSAERAADFGLASFPRLRFSREEAERIAESDRGAHPLIDLDFQASRDAASDPALRNYGIVHFASHALLDEKRPDLSGIVLSLVDEKGHPRNGLLRLDDIYNLRLNARLVVLSACRTALGQQREGEGFIGLARGFFYAGASGVLATLWTVDDRATAVFMGEYYQALLRDRLSPAASLRRAQLRLRKDPRWADPYYWAAFALYGI